MLQRRRFLGLLAAIAGGILGLARAVKPASLWRRLARSQGSAGQRTNQNELGIKITTIRRSTFRDSGRMTDMSTEPDIFYLQGERRRIENHRGFSGSSTGRIYGPRIVFIMRPDLGRMFELNLDASEYARIPYPPTRKLQPLTKEQMDARGTRTPSPGQVMKPTFRIEIVTKDTGERREMFGYLARHVITTRREIPLEGSRRQAQEMVRDGWYIDLEPQFYPSPYPPSPTNRNNSNRRSGRVYAYLSIGSLGKPEVPEVPEFVANGELETGFALQELRTSSSSFKLPDGTKRQTENKSETLVTIEKAVFDSALFEVPSGFKRVPYINRNPA